MAPKPGEGFPIGIRTITAAVTLAVFGADLRSASPRTARRPGARRSALCALSGWADRDSASAHHRRDRRTAIENATLLIDGAKIRAVLPAGRAIPAGYRVLDGTGENARPGIIGVHNHMFYVVPPNLDASGHWDHPLLLPQMTFSAPRLCLANGVTTMRTIGSVELYRRARR